MMRRYDLGDGIVEIKHSDGSDRWLVVKKVLDASKISLQVQLYRIYNYTPRKLCLWWVYSFHVVRA